MSDLAPEAAQEDRGEAEAVQPSTSTPNTTARPGPSEAASEGNGVAPPPMLPPRRTGRPKGSVNKDKLAIRRWMSPKAKKLTLKQVRIAHEIFDAALACDTVTDARLEFAGSVAKQAREYSFGKPTEHREISGPDGGPITTEALLPMEQMQSDPKK